MRRFFSPVRAEFAPINFVCVSSNCASVDGGSGRAHIAPICNKTDKPGIIIVEGERDEERSLALATGLRNGFGSGFGSGLGTEPALFLTSPRRATTSECECTSGSGVGIARSSVSSLHYMHSISTCTPSNLVIR